ncbi:phosphoenolpyruvate synthase [Antrihabitans sp. YC2-6]|uniref:phosphoenolpyruvate synthase n=1 Tax=Antrihabitans sp. YC2-6 TaxID=2799498 RepID=UPI0018F4185E|nr:phosphoenolpyruvate synthase [Antrihabitans sp. YC2-6]MBJ8345389.1 phosphoenolpyruvate synthase [Antrihabitans sp. YC2-6]
MQVLGVETALTDVTELGGGKARGLHILSSGGFDVPRWGAIGVDAFAEFAHHNQLAATLARLAGTRQLTDALPLAAQVRTSIESGEIPPAVTRVITDAYRVAGNATVAVRSSGLAEDGETLSYAGQFDSFLNVNALQAVGTAVRRCWASAYSDRSVRYLLEHGAAISGAGIAVVIQQLAEAKFSGVMFTANPITGARNEIAISSVYGIGEGLVSGAVDADFVLLDKASGRILEHNVGDKSEQYVPTGAAGTAPTPVADHLRNAPTLTDAQLTDLAASGRAIEAHYGGPQDIEWVGDDTKIWFVQSRPITALAQPPAPGAVVAGATETVSDDEIRIWDNSNIIESFSGISSPLTATTAADVYGRVYESYARSLRVPEAQRRQVGEWTPALLGYFHGRVYYNLLHWYRMVGIAPGYPLNRRVLEVALGVDENLPNDVAKTLRPFRFRSPLHRALSRTVTTATYVKRFAEIDRMTDAFMADFYRAYDTYEAVDYTGMAGSEVYDRYRRMERELVDRWGPMMVLDAILLTSSGLLFALTKLLLPDAPEWFTYAVVSPGADVESAEPARAMQDMAKYVRTDATLAEFVNTTPPDQAYAALQQSPWPEFARMVDAYISKYGYRSLDELKLETPDLREDPASLFIMLRSALPDAPLSKRPEADDYLDAHLHGVRRRVYEKLRGKVSRSLGHRERLRFCRTRAFGMVKRTIRAMGRDLARRGLLDDFTDVFYLRLDELHDCYEGTPDPVELKELVAARKAARTRDAELVAPARFTTRGADFGAAALAEQGWVPVSSTPSADAGTVLRGTPSASGVVRGRAVVVTEPADVAGGILIAYRTDPGWVAALPSASALVIERGSPLTHVAIVARELGVPTVVQVKDVTKLVRTGMTIEIDGAAGTVTILSGEDDAT